ncbi:dUTP diphosphatase [Patescibacteria group bacterium]|jgi:dUTP pyrophosphatase|nr:dUTP diphosphatase [Patescibacteria group bacterium]
MHLPVTKLDPAATLPTYAHEGDAGADLFALEEVVIAPGERVSVRTGVALAIPPGFVGLIWDKSGLSHKHGLKTFGGVIDSSYRGEVLVGVMNLGSEPYTLAAGHKVAQLLVQEVTSARVVEVDKLDDTTRGGGGFGSTGK